MTTEAQATAPKPEIESRSQTAKDLKTASHMEDIRVNLIRDVYVDKSENLRQANSYTEKGQFEMIANIEATGGLLKPLIIARIAADEKTENKPYILVDGYRRAFALLEMATSDPKWADNIRASITDAGDTTGGTKIVQLISNTSMDLNPMEKAIAIQEALDDKSCDLSQRDIARMMNLTDGAISQLLKLLRFPKEIQSLISEGYLGFSHARIILEKVPEDQWMVAATMAAGTAPEWHGMFYDDFKDKMEETYTPKTAEDGDATTATGVTTSSQKPSKMLRATEVSGNYLEFVKQRVAAADANTKSFTAQDVEKARLDTLLTVTLNKETDLAKAIAPYLEEQTKKEEAEKLEGESKKKEDSFYRKQVKRVRELDSAPADPANPNAPKPTLAQCYGTVTKEVYSMNAEAQAALGFKLPPAEEFVKKLSETYVLVKKENEEDKKKRDDKKAKEKAEADAKAAAEKAAGGTAAAPVAAV